MGSVTRSLAASYSHGKGAAPAACGLPMVPTSDATSVAAVRAAQRRTRDSDELCRDMNPPVLIAPWDLTAPVLMGEAVTKIARGIPRHPVRSLREYSSTGYSVKPRRTSCPRSRLPTTAVVLKLSPSIAVLPEPGRRRPNWAQRRAHHERQSFGCPTDASRSVARPFAGRILAARPADVGPLAIPRSARCGALGTLLCIRRRRQETAVPKMRSRWP